LATTDTTPQRVYRAPCPGCGAPVEFLSAQSTHAVCSFCRSTVVRSGDTLQRLGKMAEVFEDYSPLQLFATGRFGDRPFTLVGRLQYRSSSGAWAEWHAAFDDGGSGILSEDNGSYVLMLPAQLGRDVPTPAQLRLGASTAISGKTFTVASNDQASLVSAQGELPKLPPLGQPFAVVELRSADGEVLSLDWGSTPPEVLRGHQVQLEGLQMRGLRAEQAKEDKARQFNCPNCGAPVSVQLETTKSITCGNCQSLIDVSQGIGGELRHAIQDEPVRPLIPLGRVGKLQAVDWQVVGFQHRVGTEPGDDEQFGWSEYLLYNAQRGFAFLVDSEEGWSLVRPTTGAPKLSSDGRSATYLGKQFSLKYAYQAETTYVAGEFYWPVERGQKTFNKDFASGSLLLSMEQSPREITWSSGNAMAGDAVAQAFNLQGEGRDFQRGDAGPTSGGSKGLGCGCLLLILLGIVLFIVLLYLLDGGGRGGGSGYRSSGGSYGGYSSGGGHK
jgi:hypothetical protein